MARKPVVPEKIFYDTVTTLITNLFIKNPNYNTYEGCKRFNPDEAKKLAGYILDEIERTKHLINLNPDNTEIIWEEKKPENYPVF